MIDYIIKKFLIPTLRRASYRWPPRNEALKAARISRGLYKCNLCQGAFGRKEVNIDHIEPVINPNTGMTDWDEYITRMFCPKEGYQILCSVCHDNKTLLEKKISKKRKVDKL